MSSIKVAYPKLMKYIIDLLTKYYDDEKARGGIDSYDFDSAAIDQIFIYKDGHNKYGIVYKGAIQSLATECLFPEGDSDCCGDFIAEMLYSNVLKGDETVDHKLVVKSLARRDYEKNWEVVLNSIKNVECEVTIPAKVVKKRKWVIEGGNA